MSARNVRIILIMLAAALTALAAPQERSVTTEALRAAERESVVVSKSGQRILLRHVPDAPREKEPAGLPGQDVTSQDTLLNHDGTEYWSIRASYVRYATRLTMPARAVSQCTLRNLRFKLLREATGNRLCSVFVWTDIAVQESLHYPDALIFSGAFTAGGSVGWNWYNYNMPTGASSVIFDTSASFWIGFSRPDANNPWPGDDGSFNPEPTRNVYARPPDDWEYWGADFMHEAIIRYGRIEDDVAVTRILTPSGIIDSTANIVPACTVRNLGYNPANNYNVRMRIAGFYDQTVNVPSHAAQSAIRVEFPALNAWPRGSWTVNCSTQYAADEYRPNDRKLGTVMVRVVDGLCSQVNPPPETVDVNEWSVPQAVVLNNGTGDAVMQATMRIGGGYSNTLSTGLMLPGTQEVLTFAPWQATAAGSHPVSCSTQLAADMNPANDRFSRSVFVRYYDAQAQSVLAPSDTVDYGASVVPRAVIINASNFAQDIPVRMRIGSYNQLGQTGPLPPAAVCTLSFPVWNAVAGGLNVVRCSTELPNDANPANDRALGGVFVRLRDVRTVSIDAPGSDVDSGAPTAPMATVQNLGTTTIGFPVQMTIGAYVGTATVTALDPGASTQVTFAPAWQPQRGTYSVRCVVQDPDDMVRSNDTLNGSVIVRVRDVAVSQVVSPSGIIATGTEVTPIVHVANHGTEPATCLVRFTIRNEGGTAVYDRIETGVSIPTGGLMGYPFGQNWTAAGIGNYTAEALTFWGPDMHHENDTAFGSFIVTEGGGMLDVGVSAILSPASRIDTGTVVFPRATVTNAGSYTASFNVAFFITRDGAPVYVDVRPVASLMPSTSTTVVFDEWLRPHAEGDYVARCSTMLAGDGNPNNDRYLRSFTVGVRQPWDPGWVEMSSYPAGAPAKLLKDGAWLSYDEATDRIYAAKGNKTAHFYSYDPQGDSWQQCENYPVGVEGKLPGKGGRGVATGTGVCYALKGNNTLEFHRYTAASNSWYRLDGVPTGTSNKRIKGGSDMVYVDLSDTQRYVYLLKGQKNEFYRFNLASGQWETLEPAPANTSQKYDKGSFLAYDGAGTIYAHQSKYHRLYAFNVYLGAWSTAELPGMPLQSRYTGKNKKSKDGGAGDWSGDAIYAFKGGNTQEFYRYAPFSDSGWVELETIPAFGRGSTKRKRVKGGGGLTSHSDGALFAFKGNKTNEFWRYVWASTDGGDRARGRDGATVTGGDRHGIGTLAVAPNPLSGRGVTVAWSAGAAGPATIDVFDVTGRRVFERNLVAGRSGAERLDLGRLPAGVYLLRFSAAGVASERKLVIER